MKISKFKKSKLLSGGILFSAIAAATLTLSATYTPMPAIAAETNTQAVGGNYFLSDYDTRPEVIEASKDLTAELVSEGTVLLKNTDNALPLKTEKKLSLFGKNLYAKMDGLTGAFRNAGYEVNPALAAFYASTELTGTGSPGYPGDGIVVNGFPTGEADISKFADAGGSIQNYNDAAVVAFYRLGSEGFDLPRTMAQVNGDYKAFGENVQPVAGARAADDHYFQLDANEAKLLEYCAAHFDKIIVLINSPAPMELGFLDDPDHYAYSDKIKGAIWTDAFNAEAWSAIVDVFSGKVNPSGRLPDTYARDFKADPTWNNFGNNFMEDYANGGATVYAKGNQYANDNMRGNSGGGYYSNYVYYKEGIYSGYRYWETRGYTEGLDTQWTGSETDTLSHYAHGANEAIHYYSKTNAADKAKQDALDGKTWDNWYDAHVVFPFGYGLSYTDFTWTLDEISETMDTNGKITAKVTVTNTGDVAGKDVVQLYYNAQYITGGIEKAHVKLGAYAKTKLLEPQQSETVTLEFAVRDMASYDYSDANKNGFKGYELDAGKYNIYIGKNAHCWAEQTVITKQYDLASGVKYENDSTGGKVENRFDKISEQLLHEDRYPEDDANNEKDKYMTRADFAGTYPTLSYRLTAEQWIIDGLKEYNDIKEAPFGTVYPEDKPTDPWYNDEMPVTGAKYDTPIKLQELFGLDYEDGKWDKFLDQLTVPQLTELAMRGSYKSGIDIPELGITAVHNQDSPTNVRIPNATTNVYLPDDVLTAATWNTDIAYRRGLMLGNISLWGAGDASTRVPGWYAPAVNIHRNPFCGRVGEYFSEDGLLAGKQSAHIVIGAQEKGMWCYVKHFAVNSQETNRCGLITWADEQTMREVYFKPFEICVKEGKTLGIMSSLNRFGPRQAGGSYELLTNVLKDEWGFRGCVVTDYFSVWSNVDIMIRGGGSLVLGNGTLRIAPTSATVVNLLRNCAHEILYAHANSMAINEGETPTVPKKIRRFETKTLEIGMVNTEYSQSLADAVTLNTQYYPDLDASKVKFEIAETSALPRGLTLSEDGVISGKPKAEARLNFTVVAKYENESITQTFNIIVVGEGGAIIFGTTDNKLDASVDIPFDASVAKAYIYDPYATEDEIAAFPDITYSLANGSALPDGLTLLEDGTVKGTPTKECRDYEFDVVASAIGYRETEYTFSISVLYPLVLDNMTLAVGEYGKSYVQKLDATCAADVEFALKGGSELPKGLSLSKGGYIVGKPTEACVKTFTVVAKSDYARPVEREYTIKIEPAFDPATALVSGKVGEGYIGSVATAQGSFGLTYKIIGGALPAGLTMDADGNITGTPVSPGPYTVIVEARDGELCTEITLGLFVENVGSVKTVVKGESNAAGVAAIALGIASGVFAIGFAVMTVLYVLGKKKKQTVGAEQADDTASQDDK